jgi:hypothetical protein
MPKHVESRQDFGIQIRHHPTNSVSNRTILEKSPTPPTNMDKPGRAIEHADLWKPDIGQEGRLIAVEADEGSRPPPSRF